MVHGSKMYPRDEKKRYIHLSKSALLWDPLYKAEYSQMLAVLQEPVD